MVRRHLSLPAFGLAAAVILGGCPQDPGADAPQWQHPGSSTFDADGDGLSDQEEEDLGTSPFFPDSDFDGLLDSRELELRTDPMTIDSDGDLIFDAVEVALGLDPLVPDNLGGTVLEVYCPDFAMITTDSYWFNGGIENLSPVEDFSDWQIGDRIILHDQGTRLINVDAGNIVEIAPHGEVQSKARVEQSLTTDGELVLRDAGVAAVFGTTDTYRVVSAVDRVQVMLWLRAERIVVVTPCLDEAASWTLINADRCQAVQVEPTSPNFISPFCGTLE